MNIHNLKRMVSLDHIPLFDRRKLEEKRGHARRSSSPFEVVKLDTWKEMDELRRAEMPHDATLQHTASSKISSMAEASSTDDASHPDEKQPDADEGNCEPLPTEQNQPDEEDFPHCLEDHNLFNDDSSDHIPDSISYPPDSLTSMCSSENFTQLVTSEELRRSDSECGSLDDGSSSSSEEDQLAPPQHRHCNAVNKETFMKHFDTEGRLVYEHELRKLIFKGGVESEIRREAWTFLFELYPCNSTSRERELLKAESDLKYLALKRRWKKILCLLTTSAEWKSSFRLCPSWYLGCEMNLLQKEIDKARIADEEQKASNHSSSSDEKDEKYEDGGDSLPENTSSSLEDDTVEEPSIVDGLDDPSNDSRDSLEDSSVISVHANIDPSPAILPISCCDSPQQLVQTELADAMMDLSKCDNSVFGIPLVASGDEAGIVADTGPDSSHHDDLVTRAQPRQNYARRKTNSFGEYAYLPEADCMSSDNEEASVTSRLYSSNAISRSMLDSSLSGNCSDENINEFVSEQPETSETGFEALPLDEGDLRDVASIPADELTSLQLDSWELDEDAVTHSASDSAPSEGESQETVYVNDTGLGNDDVRMKSAWKCLSATTEHSLSAKSTTCDHNPFDEHSLSAFRGMHDEKSGPRSVAEPSHRRRQGNRDSSDVPLWIAQMLGASHHSDQKKKRHATHSTSATALDSPVLPQLDVTIACQFIRDDLHEANNAEISTPPQPGEQLAPGENNEEVADGERKRHSWSNVWNDSTDGAILEHLWNSAHSGSDVAMTKPPKCPYCIVEPALSEKLTMSFGEDVVQSMELQAHVFAGRQPYDVDVVKQALRIIDKDVPRTDRVHEYFSGDDNPKLLMLRDALITYSFFHPDVGYAQGMNDILSRFLVVMDTEADAYWMLVSYMSHFKDDFLEDGMLNKIGFVEQMLLKMDRELHEFLQHSGADLMFCHRWLLLSFKREFSYDDALRIFEIISSRHLEVSSLEAAMERSKERAKELERGEGTRLEEIDISPEYSFDIFVCVALLRTYRDMIMDSKDTSSVYQTVSCLPTYTDVTTILMKAEDLFYKYCRKSVVDCFQVIDEHELSDCVTKKR